MLVHIFESESVESGQVAIKIFLNGKKIKIDEISKGEAISLVVNVFETTPTGRHGLHEHYKELPYFNWAAWEVVERSLLIFQFYLYFGDGNGELMECSFIYEDGDWSLRE